jgi:hypothetical protein
MEVLISTVNLITKHGLNHRQLKHFLEETDEEYLVIC